MELDGRLIAGLKVPVAVVESGSFLELEMLQIAQLLYLFGYSGLSTRRL